MNTKTVMLDLTDAEEEVLDAARKAIEADRALRDARMRLLKIKETIALALDAAAAAGQAK